MKTLATNNRTSIKAAIKRGSRVARRDMNRLDSQVLGQLEQIYRSAAADIALAIQAYAGEDGNLRLSNLQDIQQQVNGLLNQLSSTRQALLDSGLEQAAGLGATAYSGVVESQTMVRVADDAVRFVRGFVASDGLQLSDRIWRIDNHAREAVGSAIESAVIQGHSASQAANEFLSRGAPVPADITGKINNANAFSVARASSDALLRDEGSPRHNAMRVFRTELNRAHGEAYMQGGEDVPGFIGWKYLLSPRHPEADICDMHARVNRYGLGAGVYPSRDRCPWPAHPNTLSYIEIVFDDEVTEDDKKNKSDRIDWLNNQPFNVQKGVLGANQKVAALQKGFLTENEITTPWRVLKQKYERKGIDLKSLVPAAQAKNIITRTDEAIKYVTDKGIETGHEHLVAFDQATGRQLIQKTSYRVNEVKLSNEDITLFRNSKNSIEVVHNHPSSSSLSLPDLLVSSSPGISMIRAAGHDGSLYSARVIADMATMRDIAGAIDRSVADTMWRNVSAGRITIAEANALHSHVQNVVLNKNGFINYSYSLRSGLVKSTLESVGDLLETIVSEVDEAFNRRL